MLKLLEHPLMMIKSCVFFIGGQNDPLLIRSEIHGRRLQTYVLFCYSYATDKTGQRCIKSFLQTINRIVFFLPAVFCSLFIYVEGCLEFINTTDQLETRLTVE